MLPKLDADKNIPKEYQDYLAKLHQTTFSGDIKTDYATRLNFATDNSPFQLLPIAVLHPKSTDDVSIAMTLAAEPPFNHCIQFTPRGGGTGTDGQSLNTCIVLDVSKHMRSILEINEKARWAKVQSGVIRDQLNDAVKPFGLFFAPTLSPSNRAVFGGMFNTDACGKGSRKYSRTSAHVLQSKTVCYNGEVLETTPFPLDELNSAPTNTFASHVIHSMNKIIDTYQTDIDRVYPKHFRYLSGYNLAMIKNYPPGKFNLNYLFGGAEGTLGITTELKVNLTPIPKHATVIVLQYDNFDTALRHARDLLDSDPMAIETIDDHIIALAAKDIVSRNLPEIFSIKNSTATLKALNIIEFSNDDANLLADSVQNLCQQIDQTLGESKSAMGYIVESDPKKITDIWNMRAKSVGLLGNLPGNRKPIPFIEDATVDPLQLADYVAELRVILDGYGLQYGMFGHVDAGCLHIRPALDLKDPADVTLFLQVFDDVEALLKKYNGIMWGEHAKGLRSKYIKDYLGESLYQAHREVKTLFDPHNQINPGKLYAPLNHQQKIYDLNSPLRADSDRTISEVNQKQFSHPLSCNGNGQCFSVHSADMMCPSYQATHDRVQSPKGRATLLREWVTQLSKQNYDTRVIPNTKGSLAADNTDFSKQVFDALSSCLGCKACSKVCPVSVNIPKYRSQFLAHYHSRYKRKKRDYLIAGIELTAKLQSAFPRLSNWINQSKLTQNIIKKLGLFDLPKLSTQRIKSSFKSYQQVFNYIDTLSTTEKNKVVAIIPDAFTLYYDTATLKANLDLLRQTGFTPLLLPFRPSGITLHIFGMLKRFKRIASNNIQNYCQLNQQGIPLLTLEPSFAVMYQDEYADLSEPDQKQEFKVNLIQQWLAEQTLHLPKHNNPTPQKFALFTHCTESTHLKHAAQNWQTIFKKLGHELTIINTGCCGMAGLYGHLSEHAHNSEKLFRQDWQLQLAALPDDVIPLATGYSCRCQTERFSAHGRLKHPAEVLS